MLWWQHLGTPSRLSQSTQRADASTQLASTPWHTLRLCASHTQPKGPALMNSITAKPAQQHI